MEATTRQLRYFVAVAEELHFTRAAQRLHVAQQALSAQVRQLEARLGVRLLDRTTRRVSLTVAGHTFYAYARAALEAIDAGAHAARHAQREQEGALRLGFVAGAALELTQPILDELAAADSELKVEMVGVGYEDPSIGLAGARVDVAILRPPIGTPGVRLETLLVEPRIAALPATHRLAGRETITVAELLREALIGHPGPDRVWNDFWLLNEFRDGDEARVAAVVASAFEELEHVAAGRACAVTARAAARYVTHPGVRFVDIVDAPGSALAVGWRADHETPPVRAFVRAARRACERNPSIVDLITGRQRGVRATPAAAG